MTFAKLTRCTLKNTIKTALLPAVLLAVIPAAAASAEQKPTLVLVHRNVHKAVDEQHWQDLADSLSTDGFRVLSWAVSPEDNGGASSPTLTTLFRNEKPDSRYIIVSTAAASDLASMAAQAESGRVQAIAYISAEPTVATLGPRTVTEPAALAGKVPSYQLRITSQKKIPESAEQSASTTLLVHEDGQSTLARVPDLTTAIETIVRKTRTA